MNRLIAVMLITVISIFPVMHVFAATNADITRVFNKLQEDPVFMPALYKVVPDFSANGITNESLDQKIQSLIGQILDEAIKQRDNGQLTKENFDEKMKAITINCAKTMDLMYINLFMKAFPNSQNMLWSLLNNQMPEEFQGLYTVIAQEAKYILGFETRPEGEVIFNDIADYAWAEEAIMALYNLDVINGVSEGAFAPADTVTREQFVKMLAIAFNITNTTNNTPTFADVPQDAWFAPYVTAMAAEGLVAGIDEANFGVGQNITRQDIAVLLYRIGEYNGAFEEKSLLNDFTDGDQIAPYALLAVGTLKSYGIISGTPDNAFLPASSATRAEAAQMIYNCYKVIQ